MDVACFKESFERRLDSESEKDHTGFAGHSLTFIEWKIGGFCFFICFAVSSQSPRDRVVFWGCRDGLQLQLLAQSVLFPAVSCVPNSVLLLSDSWFQKST